MKTIKTLEISVKKINKDYLVLSQAKDNEVAQNEEPTVLYRLERHSQADNIADRLIERHNASKSDRKAIKI